jgi:radical SAM superfamily enzyme YgiQ (UPF0313 family)
MASICSTLRARGIDVTVVADTVNQDAFAASSFCNRVVNVVRQHGPDTLVGFGAFVWNEPEAHALLEAFEAASIRDVVFGGPQVSYTSPGKLEGLYPGVQYFVRGHGEAAMVDLAFGRAENGVNGVHFAGREDLGARAEIHLDGLPSPHLDGTLHTGAFVRWETQRGCPYRCTFCQHRESGRRLRLHEFGEERLIEELRAFARRGVRRIAVLDPIFHANRGRAARLLRAAKAAGVCARMSLQCRFELIDSDFLDAVEGMDVILEFGLQTIHEDESRAVHRRNHMDRVAETIEALHERRVRFEVSLIYGLPHQTLERFRMSVQWCLDHRVPVIRAWPLMLLRGTPLHEERERWAYRESTDSRIPIVVASGTFDERDHAEMAAIARWLKRYPGDRALP